MNSLSKRAYVLVFLLSPVSMSWAALDGTTPATTPAAAPAAASAPADSKASASTVEVMRAVLTTAVDNHDPAAEITTAKVGDVVVGWNQVSSSAGEVTIHHKWLHEGTLVSDVKLVIPSSPYRTWSRKTMSEAGAWKWQITNDAGDVLKEISFTVSQ